MTRREMLVAGLVIGMAGMASHPTALRAAEGETVKGRVILLEGDDAGEQRVNAGGLVVVVVKNSGSRKPQNIKVDFTRQFMSLGVLDRAKTVAGKPAPGSGYTWHLLKPLNAGKSVITVTYKLNDEEGTMVKKTYKMNVE